MTDYKRGDERIMRVTETGGGRASWVDEGELVRCRDCVNWNTMADGVTEANIRWRKDADGDRWCPVVRKCTKHADWCCWGVRKGESDER